MYLVSVHIGVYSPENQQYLISVHIGVYSPENQHGAK
jgi:hypothetical protein